MNRSSPCAVQDLPVSQKTFVFLVGGCDAGLQASSDSRPPSAQFFRYPSRLHSCAFTSFKLGCWLQSRVFPSLPTPGCSFPRGLATSKIPTPPTECNACEYYACRFVGQLAHIFWKVPCLDLGIPQLEDDSGPAPYFPPTSDINGVGRLLYDEPKGLEVSTLFPIMEVD